MVFREFSSRLQSLVVVECESRDVSLSDFRTLTHLYLLFRVSVLSTGSSPSVGDGGGTEWSSTEILRQRSEVLPVTVVCAVPNGRGPRVLRGSLLDHTSIHKGGTEG